MRRWDNGEEMGAMKIYAKENTLMKHAIRNMPQQTYNAIAGARLKQ